MNLHRMENKMKKKLLALLLLSLALTGCIVDPGYRGGGDHDRGWSHSDRDSHGNWGR